MSAIIAPGADVPRTIQEQRLLAKFELPWAVALLLCDVAGFVAAAALADAIVQRDTNIGHLAYFFTYSSYIFVLLWLALFYFLGLYRQSFALSVRDEFYYSVAAIGMGILPQFALFTIVPRLSSSRAILLLAAALAVVLVGGIRAIIHAARAAMRERQPQRVAILGNDDRPVPSSRSCLGVEDGAQVYWIKLDAAALRKAYNLRCNRLVLTAIPPRDVLDALVNSAWRYRLRVTIAVPELHSGCCGFSIGYSGDQVMMEAVRPPVCSPVGAMLKRLLDLSITVPVLLVAAPSMLGVAVAIWLDDGLPLLYRQERIGCEGHKFTILKFRTMRNAAPGRHWATRNDPRVTRVGRFLRRTSLDELPQLFNVLTGDMSLVGPRPEMSSWAKEFAERFPDYMTRHLVPPGITGWSQVHMKRLLEPEDVPGVLEHDLFYIKHWSVLLDLSIICKTAIEFLFHRGA